MKLISIDELKAFLKSGEFKFIPTQSKLCLPIIQRIHYKMKLGIDFESISVHESLIVNGHHRYISSLLAGIETEIKPWALPADTLHYNWENIELDENDWESIYTIGQHNKRDAQRTGHSIEIFDILIKSSPNNV